MVSVILIEDELDTAETFSNVLMMKGIQVMDIQLNGEKALESYKEFHPDVVLTDIMMPESDGFDVIKKIREFDPEAKIVCVTADFRAETETNLIEQNASAILYKPYDIDEVVKTINDVHNGIMELS